MAAVQAALRRSSIGISRNPREYQSRARSASNRTSVTSLGSAAGQPDPLGRRAVPNRLKSSAGRYTRPSR